jgi:hypothetical protein
MTCTTRTDQGKAEHGVHATLGIKLVATGQRKRAEYLLYLQAPKPCLLPRLPSRRDDVSSERPGTGGGRRHYVAARQVRPDPGHTGRTP